jgi:hypothetical protein
MSGDVGSFLTTTLGTGPRDERGEGFVSALCCAPGLEEVGEASSRGGSLERELGVTWWGERVEGAMGAYVLDEPTPSADAGAACWAGAGGLATTVVMVACGRPCEARWEGQIDCRSEVWQGLVGSPLHQVSRDVGRPGGVRGWCNTKPGPSAGCELCVRICTRAEW